MLKKNIAWSQKKKYLCKEMRTIDNNIKRVAINAEAPDWGAMTTVFFSIGDSEISRFFYTWGPVCCASRNLHPRS